eukprot:TRINITY_DN5638_c0_g2_i1.p1 TRINITY_DN5638_c0_g2~~TRINITY_DN5638_c0_g2_i1.p1  ORF type:complete len:123 (-),score=10.60 TRINITY_DN5638_c0_g2_i1:94-462(-)
MCIRDSQQLVQSVPIVQQAISPVNYAPPATDSIMQQIAPAKKSNQNAFDPFDELFNDTGEVQNTQNTFQNNMKMQPPQQNQIPQNPFAADPFTNFGNNNQAVFNNSTQNKVQTQQFNNVDVL